VIRNGPIEARDRARRRWWQLGRTRNRRVRPVAPGDKPASAAVAAVAPDEKTAPSRRWRRAKQAAKALGALAAAGAVAAGAIGGWRFVTRSRKFAVREVRVSPTTHARADELRARAGIAVGDNLFLADLDAATREILADPWIASARLHRELPDVVAVDVVEREPACVVAFGPLYLADARGEVFKRATPDEAASLPVVTGVPRDAYVDDREAAQAMVREALEALQAWRERPRPPVGEVHVDAADGVTLFLVKDAVGVRIGVSDGTRAPWRARLARYDAVASALRATGEAPQTFLVDGKRADRVTVRLRSKL